MKFILDSCLTFLRRVDALVAFARLCTMFFVLSIGGYASVASGQDIVAPVISQAEIPPQVESLPELRVGDLSFRVEALRVSAQKSLLRPFHSSATISMTITNHGNSPISLNYVFGKTSFVNEHGYSWRDEEHSGQGVSGLPVEKSDAASVEGVIEPGGTRPVSIPLFFNGSREGQTPGKSYNFSAEFSSYEDIGEGRLRLRETYPVAFAGLKKTVASAPMAAQVAKSNEGLTAQAEPLPEVRVGDLNFRVDSLRIAEQHNHPSYSTARAVISMTITNLGETPISLNYVWGNSSFVNEHGYIWADDHLGGARGVIGMPQDKNGKIGLKPVIEPGSQLQVTIPKDISQSGDGSGNSTLIVGDVFDFAAEFSAYRDKGEGLAKKIRIYPVSFVGLRRSVDVEEKKKGFFDW